MIRVNLWTEKNFFLYIRDRPDSTIPDRFSHCHMIIWMVTQIYCHKSLDFGIPTTTSENGYKAFKMLCDDILLLAIFLLLAADFLLISLSNSAQGHSGLYAVQLRVRFGWVEPAGQAVTGTQKLFLEGVTMDRTTPWQATEPIYIHSSAPNLEKNVRLMPHPRVLRRNGLTYPTPCSPESPTLQMQADRKSHSANYYPKQKTSRYGSGCKHAPGKAYWRLQTHY